MNHRLENKRALVTGGSRGIGAAIVKRLAREGAHVALTYVGNSDRAGETVKAAEASGVKALAVHADSADAKAVVAAVERTVRELGGIDILVFYGIVRHQYYDIEVRVWRSGQLAPFHDNETWVSEAGRSPTARRNASAR